MAKELGDHESIREVMDGIGAGLVAIDQTLRKAHGGGKGAPGSGLFYLLDQLAVSTLGVPRTPFPTRSTSARELTPEEERYMRDNPAGASSGPAQA
jgi:hypothetical protein